MTTKAKDEPQPFPCTKAGTGHCSAERLTRPDDVVGVRVRCTNRDCSAMFTRRREGWTRDGA